MNDLVAGLIVIVGGFAAFATVLGTMFFKGKAAGRDEVKEQVRKENDEIKEVAKDVENNVKRMSDDAITEQLRDKWTRKP